MVNTPIPHSLRSEAKKAAKILKEFTMPSAKTGPDKLIPVGILAKAKGLAILTVFKAGFLVTARGGSGIVIAKLRDSVDYSEGWSAPSAIGLAGLGGGFEIGMEVTDFVIILNTWSAVDAFSKGGNLTLGGNFTIAVGPLGRNLEGDIAVRSPAAIYTYSKTKGIFAGISVEGSALIERKDANRKFYGHDIRAFEILSGNVQPPEECQALYSVMKEHQEMAARAALKLARRHAETHASAAVGKYANDTGLSLPSASKSKFGGEKSSSFSYKTTVTKTSVNTVTTAERKMHSPDFSRKAAQVHTVTTVRTTTSRPDLLAMNTRMPDRFGDTSVSDGTTPWLPMSAGPTLAHAVALFPYTAQLTCDLSFKAGDEIEIVTRTPTQNDWWEGKCGGRVGIFPANYIRVL